MKIGVFSDTHGNRTALRRMIQACGPFDYLFHLGDGVGDALEVSDEMNIPLCCICGNEDQGGRFPRKQKIALRGWNFLLMHGDQFDITPYHSGVMLEGIYENMTLVTAMEGCDILLFGHTHRPLLTERNNIILCNPGDQYVGSTRPASCAVILVDSERVSFSIREEDGNPGCRETESLVLVREGVGEGI